MTLPKPIAGLVVRYGFLWSHENERGATEAAKDRPAAIVVAVRRASDGAIEAIVAPITHAAPGADQSGIELSPEVCRQIGLDSERQWLRSDELNAFVWPGFDLRKRPGKESFAYGMLPADLFERLRMQIVARRRAGQARLTKRD